MSGELVTKTEPCLSVTDQVKGLPGLSTDEIERTSREKLGLCRAPKPCGRIGRERRLCRVKAVRTMAMAGSRQSRAGVSDGSEGFAVSKPCGR